MTTFSPPHGFLIELLRGSGGTACHNTDILTYILKKPYDTTSIDILD